MSAAPDNRRVMLVAVLVFVASAAITVSWCGTMASMPGMEMAGGWTMSMAWMRMPGQGWPGAAAVFLGMWTVMMLAMMLPAVLPVLARERHTRSALALATGYFATWLLAGVALFPAGAWLADVAMRDAGIARFAPCAAGLVLIMAGALQSGRWKARALARCRDAGCCPTPAQAGDWRRDVARGLSLGARCVRCCAPWTAVLLVIGVMDVAAMTLVTAAISLERLLPRGERVARMGGIAMLAAGALVLSGV
jgi:predicted metal-binding membrane protein